MEVGQRAHEQGTNNQTGIAIPVLDERNDF